MKVQTLGQEDPLEKDMATHSSILAWESHRQRNLVSYSPWGHKESDMTEHACTINNTAHVCACRYLHVYILPH